MSDQPGDIMERIEPLLTAVTTFRTLASASEAGADWKRSAFDNLMRELAAFQATEETKRIAELEGLLRDLLEHLGEGNEMAIQIRDALGVTTVPPSG